MKKCKLVIFSLVISISCFSQPFELEIDSVIKIEIGKLVASNIDEIGYTKLSCINYGITTTAYLFWNEGNKTYLQKFTDSEDDKKDAQKYKPFVILDSVFFTFYKSNSDCLTKECIKPFSYKSDSIVGKSSDINIIITSHSCYRNFKLFRRDIIFNKYFNFFDLREFDLEQIDNSKLSKEEVSLLNQKGWEVDTTYKNKLLRNINYKTNNDLKIVKWDLLLSKFIDKIETKDEFIEIND